MDKRFFQVFKIQKARHNPPKEANHSPAAAEHYQDRPFVLATGLPQRPLIQTHVHDGYLEESYGTLFNYPREITQGPDVVPSPPPHSYSDI